MPVVSNNFIVIGSGFQIMFPNIELILERKRSLETDD